MANDVMGSWKLRAECRDLDDPEVMFPLGEGTGTPAVLYAEARAKAICARCPVIQTCRDWAIESRQEYGIWGGMNTDERKADLAERVR